MQHMLALMALDQKGRENRESQTSLSQVLTRSNGIEPALQMEVPAGLTAVVMKFRFRPIMALWMEREIRPKEKVHPRNRWCSQRSHRYSARPDYCHESRRDTALSDSRYRRPMHPGH